MTQPSPHIPVLLDEVIHALAITPGSDVVDGTFGAGGYSRAFLAAGARVHAFDRDPDAVAAIEAGLAELERGETVTMDDLHRERARRRATR